ncbi:MAG: hypothetical protein WC670_19375 [Pseudolabrys sp.]|jgi:hypothetical protein
MAMGSLVPGFLPMQTPAFKPPNMGQQGLAILNAAMRQGPAGGAPTGPATAPGGAADPSGSAPGAAPQQAGLLAKLMQQFRGGMAGAGGGGPIDPNSGLPVTADVLAGAAGGGMPQGPAPNALTGLW